MRENKLTDKQRSVLDVIKKGNSDGTNVDIDQILERIEYTTTKESLQFSLRFLIKRGLIMKVGLQLRRGKNRVIYQAMGKAYRV